MNCDANRYLKVIIKSRCDGHIKIVGLSICSRLRELPELAVVVLRSNEGGDHGEGSLERSVRPGVDEELVGESCSVAGARNVDIGHVSSGDLSSNLGNQVKDELDIIRLALLLVHIPMIDDVVCKMHCINKVESYQLLS